MAAREYYSTSVDATSAIGAYGPIAHWDVSLISDMNALFSGLRHFDAEISNWDTSSVTTMEEMFMVRSARALDLSLESGLTHFS